MITLFNYGDTVGPKQVFESHQKNLQEQKAFFAHFKAKHDVSLKALFDAKHAIFEEHPAKT